MLGSICGVPFHVVEATLKQGDTPEEKADAFNLIAHIADESVSLESIVENVMNGTVPKVVAPKE